MPLLTDIRILFGKLMRATMADSATTIALAQEAYDYWISVGALRIVALSLLGDIEGEDSFQVKAIGDHGKAYSLGQWHDIRVHAIMIGCGIDVRTASFHDALVAMHWEMTVGSYKRVWPKLMATTTIEAAVEALVHDFEQSSQQARDIARRTALAQKWAGIIPG